MKKSIKASGEEDPTRIAENQPHTLIRRERITLEKRTNTTKYISRKNR
jgi:hypothetical protein